MNRKQEIYCDMLWWVLPGIRNIQSLPWWRRIKDRSCYLESQLVHQVGTRITEKKVTDDDVLFLNHHARWYLTNATPQNSLNYHTLRKLIGELFAIVAKERAGELEWDGPG